MSQGDIHRTRDGQAIVCRVQTDLPVDSTYVLCAAVTPREGWGPLTPRLNIPFTLGGVPHVIVMTQMASLHTSMIGDRIGTADHLRDEIVAAVDLLVAGF